MIDQVPVFHPVAAKIGAIVEGVDLSRPLSDEAFATIKAGLYEHHVLFFREQDLTEEDHMALAARFGPPDIHPFDEVRGIDRPVTYIRNDAENRPVADSWHTDLSFRKNPPAAALLNARIIPGVGGDTLWTSLPALWASLSPVMQDLCRNLQVRHWGGTQFWSAANAMLSAEEVDRVRDKYETIEHPLVCRHPVTGEEFIFMAGRQFMDGIVGMNRDESDALLELLHQKLNDPNHQVRWRWQPHDLAIWDEPSTNHRAPADHYPQEREMRRCVVAGVPPVAA